PKASARFLLTIPELPMGCTPLTNDVVADRNKKKFYKRIAFRPEEGPEIEFLLVAKEDKDDPDSFYIMKYKVGVRDFRPYARRNGIAWKSRVGDEYPALGVRFQDAYDFATRWIPPAVGGNLPTALQWDRAAGRWVKGREGPYEGKWGKSLAGKGK